MLPRLLRRWSGGSHINTKAVFEHIHHDDKHGQSCYRNDSHVCKWSSHCFEHYCFTSGDFTELTRIILAQTLANVIWAWWPTHTIVSTRHIGTVVYLCFTKPSHPCRRTNAVECDVRCLLADTYAGAYEENRFLLSVPKCSPWFWQVSSLQGRRSLWHRMPWKPAKQEQLNPYELSLVLLQIPLFWHGWSTSHGALDTRQVAPIFVEFGHVDGTKKLFVSWTKSG